MKPQVIHSSSTSVKTVGIIFIVFGVILILAGLAVLVLGEESGGVAGIIFGAALLTIFWGVLIKGFSPLIRAAETYLYEVEDHPLGSAEDIAHIQHVADHGIDIPVAKKEESQPE